LFNGLLDELKERVTSLISHVQIGAAQGSPEAPPPPPRPAPVMFASHPAPRQLVGAEAEAGPALAAAPALLQPYRAEHIDPARPESWVTTPRNAPCPCGSGKKYKYCHGKV
jgi:preprotein translocase subunit SecA